MAERAEVFEASQWGAEVTPGTAVAAGKRLQSTSIMPKPNTPADPFRPVGSKAATQVSLQKEWTSFPINGVVNYTDIVYLLNSLLKAVTGTGAGAGKTHTFKPATFGPDTIQTFSIESGSGVQAEKFNYAFVNSLELRFARGEASLRGTGIGRKLAESASLTGAPTDVPKMPVHPKNVSVYVADSEGGLAAGKLDRCLDVGLGIRNARDGIFTLDGAQDSFSADVEMARDLSAQLVVARNSVAAGYMADLRTAKTKFLRIKATSPVEVETGIFYDLQITHPFNFREDNPGENQGVRAAQFDLLPIYDATFAGWIEVIVVSSVGGL